MEDMREIEGEAMGFLRCGLGPGLAKTMAASSQMAEKRP